MSADTSAAERGFPFWSFSVALYGRPGVAPACLALQDRFGCDVNLLLLALWAAKCGRELGRQDFERLDAALAPWRARVLEPIRAVRRQIKADPIGATPELAEACRQALLKAELAGERAAQELLARSLPLDLPQQDSGDGGRARANLEAYLTWRGPESAEARKLAGTILAAL